MMCFMPSRLRPVSVLLSVVGFVVGPGQTSAMDIVNFHVGDTAIFRDLLKEAEESAGRTITRDIGPRVIEFLEGSNGPVSDRVTLTGNLTYTFRSDVRGSGGLPTETVAQSLSRERGNIFRLSFVSEPAGLSDRVGFRIGNMGVPGLGGTLMETASESAFDITRTISPTTIFGGPRDSYVIDFREPGGTVSDRVTLTGLGLTYRFQSFAEGEQPAPTPGALQVLEAEGLNDIIRLDFRSDLEPVPEPSTLLLVGSGLAGLGGMAWRRRRNNLERRSRRSSCRLAAVPPPPPDPRKEPGLYL